MWTFETENIAVAVRPNSSDLLLVTFSHMDFPHQEGKFWCEAAVDKLGYAAVGIVCKSNCWYPVAEMRALAQSIRNVARDYKTVLLYGHSMGGYAAIKYSALLQSHRSIAVSPQFSIDPRDLCSAEGALLDARLVHLYQPALNAGMAIDGPDIGGSIYMVFDPREKLDAWNCARIAQRGDPRSCTITNVRGYNLDHCAVDVFASTARFSQLAQLCAEDDVEAFLRAFAGFRRTADRRVFNVLKALKGCDLARTRRLAAARAPGLHEYWRKQVEDLCADPAAPAL
jgi:pimeloyl-ACP methyl ester carboxylesterase